MRQARNRSSNRFLGYISHVARFDVEATEIEWKATGIEEGNKQDRKEVKGENQKKKQLEIPVVQLQDQVLAKE